MNKRELVRAISEKTGISMKSSEACLNAFLETVTEELAEGNKVQLIGFGTFKTVERKARQGRNPRNPEEVFEIPAAVVPKLEFGKPVKDAVNK